MMLHSTAAVTQALFEPILNVNRPVLAVIKIHVHFVHFLQACSFCNFIAYPVKTRRLPVLQRASGFSHDPNDFQSLLPGFRAFHEQRPQIDGERHFLFVAVVRINRQTDMRPCTVEIIAGQGGPPAYIFNIGSHFQTQAGRRCRVAAVESQGTMSAHLLEA